jgi:hypothetical protein
LAQLMMGVEVIVAITRLFSELNISVLARLLPLICARTCDKRFSFLPSAVRFVSLFFPDTGFVTQAAVCAKKANDTLFMSVVFDHFIVESQVASYCHTFLTYFSRKLTPHRNDLPVRQSFCGRIKPYHSMKARQISLWVSLRRKIRLFPSVSKIVSTRHPCVLSEYVFA